MLNGRYLRLFRAVLIVAALVLLHAVGREPVLRWLAARPVPAVDTSDDQLAVMSWNLRNFPRDHDVARMAQRIEAFAPHVLVLEEVNDPAALSQVVPGRRVLMSNHGGRGHQRLGFALDDRVEVLAPLQEHCELELGGRVRPAVSTYLRIRDGGPDFHVVAVHLKATPKGYERRKIQWEILADVLTRIRQEGPGAGDPDILVMGDFNTTGAPGNSAAEEVRELEATLARVGLRPLPNPTGCSAYWDGPRRDAWLEPSLLDLAFAGGFSDSAVLHSSILGACAQHACSAIRSTDAHPEPELTTMSDHCPLLVELESP